MDTQRTELPGIGTRFRLHTRAGNWLGVIRHTAGQRDLLVYAEDDPDTVRVSVALTPEEAWDLGYILATRQPETLTDRA